MNKIKLSLLLLASILTLPKMSSASYLEETCHVQCFKTHDDARFWKNPILLINGVDFKPVIESNTRLGHVYQSEGDLALEIITAKSFLVSFGIFNITHLPGFEFTTTNGIYRYEPVVDNSWSGRDKETEGFVSINNIRYDHCRAFNNF